jgi:hypothetical protein
VLDAIDAHELEATQSYSPASAALNPLMSSELAVAPGIAVRFFLHCSVGVGTPLAATDN